MTSIVALVDHVGPDWELLAWAVLVFAVIVLIATVMWRTRNPKARRRSKLGGGTGHDTI
jgi:uncharacterized membrane protein